MRGRFSGWARQPGQRTVQDALERALGFVLANRFPHPWRRTDAGVHAWGQVASYGHEALDPLRLNSFAS